MKQGSEHLEFEMQIPDFLRDRLSNEELEQFLNHYDHCKDCKEELAVRYLIEEGLSRLETGEPFHLQKELGSYVALQKGRLARRLQFVRLTIVYEAITVLAFAGFVVSYLIWR